MADGLIITEFFTLRERASRHDLKIGLRSDGIMVLRRKKTNARVAECLTVADLRGAISDDVAKRRLAGEKT